MHTMVVRMSIDTERADVSAITTVFNADFKKKAVRPGDGSDLVWSPTDSQDHLIGLINGAASSLRIYSEEMGDRTVENALIRAAKRGVDVQVCGENESGEYDSAFAKLARAGLRVGWHHHAHGLHAPYWWLKCAVGVDDDKHPLVSAYHRMLVWDIMRKPAITRRAEQALNPLIGKSLVVYAVKTEPASGRADG